MSTGRLFRRVLLLAMSLALIAAHYLEVVRPAVLTWGATLEETAGAFPGDDIVPDRGSQSTRAITINAPAEAVWPWLAQVGQDRGGFYSFDLLENLVGCDMPTDDVLQPDKQKWTPGDRLWMYPSHKAGGAGYATLRKLIPGRSLAFATRMFGTPLDQPENGSWSFILVPIDARHTRLVLRGRGSPRQTMGGVGFDVLIFEPLHFVMERRMMIGLKELAERGTRDRMANHVHVILWFATFVTLLIAAVRVVRRPDWIRPLATFIAATGTFELLTLLQPSPGEGAALLVLLAGLCLERGRRAPGGVVGNVENASRDRGFPSVA